MGAGDVGATVAGYRLERLIWKNQGETAYAGVRSSDGLPITAKVYDRALYEQAPSRFEYESRALCALNGAGLTPALARVDWGDRRALLFARPAGKPLLEEVAGVIDLPRFLGLACQAAAALGALHERRLTHRHLRPQVLLLDAASGRLVLTDLGFSLGQDRAARDLQSPTFLEATLPYVSPEQTGRIARAIDRRSDLYSMGTVLYQLAAGQPPFSASDVPELIHAHLACTPVPLVEQRRDLPQVVSDIIDRLLAKDPVERYQSAEGLLADLQKCQSRLDRGRVAGFDLRTEDQLEAFAFAERLYGRELEVAALHSAIEQARQGRSSVVLISGVPGIGKTALVEGTRRALLERGGNFAAGKFDVTRRGAPFLALAQAVASLVDGLIAQATPELARWRTRLLDGLAGLASPLFELAPALRGLLGDQPALPPASSLEANRRLQLALVRFVRAVASSEQPLLLFIDDLQWSDPGSLEVWQRLAFDEHCPGLVLVGAYRTHEVGPDHPLRNVIERLEAKGALSQHIQLGALSPDAAAQLIGEALHIDAERAAGLGRTLARRTEHNPLVIRRLLSLMVERQILIRERRGWSWSDERLRDVGLPESLLDVIHTKIDALAPEPRAALLAASSLGSAFDTESLAAALAQDPVTTFGVLGDLREQGLLCEADGLYRFEHDGVLEAASLRLSEADRYAHHERAGRFRRARAGNEALEAEAFTIIGHLNRTIEREGDPERLVDLARLNLVAGSKAASSAAFESAISHLGAGLGALRRREAIDGQREALLASQLELERARARAFSGDYSGANTAFDQLLASPLPALRLAAVCGARVEVAINAGEFEDAVSWGLVGLAHTGLVLPRHPSKGRLTRELLRAGWMTRGDLGRRIRELPRCEQEAIQVRIELLAVLVIAAIRVGGDIVPLLFLAGARDTFRHGTTPAAPHALTTFGTLLVGLFGKLTAAAELADEALVLAREPGARHRSKVILASHSMLLPWTRPFEICIEELSGVFPAALLEGDVVFAGYGLVFVSNCHMAMGVPIARLRSSAERARNYLSGAATPDVVAGQELLLGIADWLSGASDRSIDEDDPFGVLTNADPSVRCPSVVYAAALHCIADRAARALRLIETIEPSAELTLLAVAERGEYFFWRALAAAMAAERRGFRRSPGRRRLLGGLRRFQRWAKLCPENFEAKALLLEAEWTRLSSSPGKAAALYRRAAEAAEGHGRLHIAALAYERLARTGPSPELSQRRVVQLAIDAYAAWGAAGKASLLGEEFRHLLSSDSPVSSRPGEAVNEPPPSIGHVDLASVLKTTRAVTSAPNYATVVERLMAGLIENAGAQRGVLVMQGDAGWTVEIACSARGPEPEAAGVPLSAAERLVPVGMLLLVQSKQAAVIFDDAQDAHSLARDPYVAARRVRAAMCIPIELQNRCIGAIYLENNLSPGVFTRERIEIVVALAAQAAISLTNARLFGALRASEAEWRSLVDHAPDSIMIVDREHRIEFINHAPDGSDGRALLHARVDAFMFATGGAPLGDEIDRVFGQSGHVSCDTLYTSGRGSRSLVTRISPIAIDGKVARVTLLSTDVTERRALEEHLAQTQKLEAIGRLAGGVAHDFNNLLSVIVSSCELGLRSSPGDEAHSKRYEAILATTSRATGLTRQLLTFSRKGASDIECLCLNQVVDHSCSMLERLLGEDVRLERQLAPELGRVLMNRSQLEQVLLNLSINARDAMPGGGTLTLRTREVDLDSSHPFASVVPGRYACLTVTDTGSGMDEATRQRVFEPFFTTKEIGRGTGLGLATVHGIAHRAGGHVHVTSTTGRGSTFDVFLPLARAERAALEARREPDSTGPDLPRGSETILLVEDNDDVRRLAAAMLEGQGYHVITEATGQAALLNTAAIAAADLLLTDMLLPGLRGRDLAREVSRRKPGIKLLYSSGRDPELDQAPDEPSPPPFLAKPYNLAQLAHTVRSLLDARR
jgi:signal transduction histidine kinase/CheY-like chemotaxis protein